jgi:uncharacterized protein (DUF2236 family)
MTLQPPQSVTWLVHVDRSMWVGGVRGLMLQALHPVAMRGVWQNSDFRRDPIGRLRRTADFVGVVTWGTAEEADRLGRRVRGIHRALRAKDPDTGRVHRVDDPELLLWVHCTEVDSFLSTYLRSGGRLEPGQADQYVDEMRESARLVGLDPETVPRSTAEIEAYLQRMRPELRVTQVAAEGAVWGFVPPMPLWVKVLTPARPAWIGLVSVAAGLLPRWARRLYGLPGLPTTDLAALAGARALRRTLLALPDSVASNPAYVAARRRLAETEGLRLTS